MSGRIPDPRLDNLFRTSRTYERVEVMRIAGVPEPLPQGGDWFTGSTYFEPLDAAFIFANIDTAGRTGHDYHNHWDDQRNELDWSARGGSRLLHPSIERLLCLGGRVFIFTRTANTDPFTFRGLGVPRDVRDAEGDTPVRVVWALAQPASADDVELRAAVAAARSRGHVRPPAGNRTPQRADRTSGAFVRDAEVVAYVLGQANGQCEVCSETAPFVGDDGEPFLECHHLVRLADGGPDIVENAVAACPNCHRQLHYGRAREQLTADVRERVPRCRQAG